MDPLTHGLASYSITRAAFPRASRATLIAAILAGMAADLDELSAYIGPGAFLEWHRAALHSVTGTVAIVVVFLAATWILNRRFAKADPVSTVFLALLATCSLHVVMDLTQNERVQLLWPFRAQRYSADWVAHFDLWILLVLLAGALLPQLLALVTEEIGARSRGPRGHIGAIIGLAVVLVYAGGRFILHGNAVAMMEARTYRGELPHHVAAFAESDSPWRWRGLVETERAFHELELSLGGGSSFSPDAAVILYKPESSAPLEAAGRTDTVRRFLQSAKFPRATVEKTNAGYRVELRDLSQSQESQGGRSVIAEVETDARGKTLDDELAWAKQR
jgi:membrane-bound metal-dependent hydrolase YbcI (DUF457 family)